MDLKLPDRSLQLDSTRPAIMGILNVGNDSVADSSQFADVAARVERGRELVREGADIVDVGAISGRTDTPAIAEDQEIALLAPVVRGLAADGVIVSVDTWRPAVVAAVLEAGAAIVNDISGLADPRVARLAADAGAGLVIMHTAAAPKQRHFPGYADSAGAVLDFLEDKLAEAQEQGLPAAQAIIDPGLDYAKTPEESIAVLRRLDAFQALGRPILLAVSRKYFIGIITGRQPEDRLPGTLAAIEFGIRRGASIVRVHDVAAVADFLAVSSGLRAADGPQLKGDPGDESLMWIPPKRAGDHQ